MNVKGICPECLHHVEFVYFEEDEFYVCSNCRAEVENVKNLRHDEYEHDEVLREAYHAIIHKWADFVGCIGGDLLDHQKWIEQCQEVVCRVVHDKTQKIRAILEKGCSLEEGATWDLCEAVIQIQDELGM